MTVELHTAGNGWNSRRWYTHDGNDYPSVTTILKAINKPALVGWAAKSVAEYAANNIDQIYAIAKDDPAGAVDLLKGTPWRERDKAASLGSRVHRLLEGDGEGASLEEQPYVDAWAKWLEATGTKVIAQEIPVASTKYGYGGTVDLIAEVDGRVGVLDVKTGKTVADRDGAVYLEIALQLAAYASADAGWPDGLAAPFERAAVLHVRPEGVSVFKVDDIPNLLTVFASTMVLAEAMGLTKTGGNE
jgi:hypothetical protein